VCYTVCMHYSDEYIIGELQKTPKGLRALASFHVTLTGVDSAWNPASTKTSINGPAKVGYRMYSDGGISATVRKV
jgi:hypothetical protein